MIQPSLIHQNQPDNYTCVCTSIAILIGKPASEVIEKWHKKYYEEGCSIREILDDYGVHYKEFKSMDRLRLDEIGSGYYLVTVPSLNIPGGQHQILFEFDNEEFEWCIYDPQAGKEGSKWYQAIKKQNGNAYPLTAYIIDAYIPYPGGIYP